MKLFNQYTKYLLSGSIIAATLLSSTNVSLASGTNTEDNKNQVMMKLLLSVILKP